MGTDQLSTWQNPHIDSLALEVRDVLVEKARQKLLELPLLRKE